MPSSGFLAWADHSRGAVLLAQGQPEAALEVLRTALQAYVAMRAPDEAATVRILIADADRMLGDTDAAPPGGLTDREAEVLAQIASGATNKQAAAALFISEKTVARHLANIFAKLGLSSRTAAAAWAHEHRLRRPVPEHGRQQPSRRDLDRDRFVAGLGDHAHRGEHRGPEIRPGHGQPQLDSTRGVDGHLGEEIQQPVARVSREVLGEVLDDRMVELDPHDVLAQRDLSQDPQSGFVAVRIEACFQR